MATSAKGRTDQTAERSLSVLVLRDRPLRVADDGRDFVIQDGAEHDRLHSITERPKKGEVAGFGGDPPDEVSKGEDEGVELLDRVHLTLLLDELDVFLRPEELLVFCPSDLDEAEASDDVDRSFDGIRIVGQRLFIE
jgi:hypothetical protein